MVSSSRRSKRRGKSSLAGNHQRSYLWGRNLVLEVLRAAHWPVKQIFLRDDLPEDERHTLSELLPGSTPTLKWESMDALTARCGARDHQGFVARMAAFPYQTPDWFADRTPSRILLLDRMQDPHNFGAVLRSAEILGTEAVIVGDRGQSSITGHVARSSAGAVAHLPIVRTEDLPGTVRGLIDRGLKVYAATEQGEVPPDQIDWRSPHLLIVGNEGVGVHQKLLALCDRQVAIPQHGRVGSLNAAVAAGVLLYEADRQRRTDIG